jgi:Mrp family chromosome partitioning ATPase
VTRIFDALRKSRTAAGASSSPLYPPPPPPLAPVVAAPPAPVLSSASPAARAREQILPRIEMVDVVELPEEVGREMTTLRIGIDAALEDRGRVVLFASSQGGEGATTVAARFAMLLAGDPRIRALLVDLHARRPAVARRLGLEPEPAPRKVRPAPMAGPKLAVMPVSEEARRRGLFSPMDVRETLAAVSDRFDWIILDGPPVLESPDAVELAALADGMVIVLQAGSTKRPVVIRAVELLRKGGARVLGSVLNRRRLEIPEFLYRRI